MIADEEIRSAIERSQQSLFALQHADGRWQANLFYNSWTNASYIITMHALGMGDDDSVDRAARWILDRQNTDGSWGVFDYSGSPSDLEITCQAVLALDLAGYGNLPEVERGRAYADNLGGVMNATIITQVYQAVVGRYFWNSIPPLPVELVLIPDLPGLAPIEMSTWAKIGFTPVMMLVALNAPGRRSAIKELALGKAKAWVLDHQNADGSWYSTILPTSLCAIALRKMGVPPEDPHIQAAVRFMKAQQDANGYVHRYRYPVWNTALVATALLDSGVSPSDPRLLAAGNWLVDAQTGADGHAWPFHPLNFRYPDLDDTSLTVAVLKRLDLADRSRDPIRRGVEWLLDMQSSDGGWAAFTKNLSIKEPGVPPAFNQDPSTGDVVGHVLLGLGTLGYRTGHPAVDRAVAWLKNDQYHGAWYGRWGVCYTYGTAAALVGLNSVHADMQAEYVRDAVAWLEGCQNDDGGWGESHLSYYYPWQAGKGDSTVEQTAWALMGLLSGGANPGSESVQRGIRYVLDTQSPDGGWPSAFTDAALWVYKDDLYSSIFALTALARYAA